MASDHDSDRPCLGSIRDRCDIGDCVLAKHPIVWRRKDLVEELDNQRVLDSFLGGALNLLAEKDDLNKINVFPVADGDTGSNLASLMQAILDRVDPNTSSVNMTLNSVATASLIGARGNSGIIFAQYLNAVARMFEQGEQNALGFASSFEKAVPEAYQALLEPKEGTILTVMRVWSESLYERFLKEETLEKALIFAEKKAYEAVKQTEFQLSVLRKNQLVDSGAKGFYRFIEGFTATYCNKEKKSVLTSRMSKPTMDFSEVEYLTEEPTHRYCSEFLLKDVQIELPFLKEHLQSQGDSLILAGSKSQLKVHIHTDRPQEVLKELETHGTITHQKVDDMLLQFSVTKQPKYKIAIITDSIADLPKEFLLEEQIHVLPMNILNESASYLDKYTIDSSIVHDKIKNNQKMSTAQPSIQSVDSLLSFLEDKYEEILVITVSSKLSGTYQLLKQRIAARSMAQDRIVVIDSKLNSVAQGLLVETAVQAIKKGDSFAQVIQTVEDTIARCFIYVAVADIAPMVQSGRIPKGLGKIAQALHLYPIVSLSPEGEGKLSGIAFSQKGTEKKILKKVNALLKKDQIEALAITHADNAPKAQDVKKRLAITPESLTVNIVESSAAIAISAGVGCVAVAGIVKKEDNA